MIQKKQKISLTTKTEKPKKFVYLHLLILTLLGFIVYSNTFKNPLIWDDEVIIVNNPLIKNLKTLPTVFLYDIFGEKLVHGNQFYRPIQLASYYIDYAIGNLNPFIYHFFNIILHILNAILIYFLLYYYLETDTITSFIASKIFIVHPVNTQAVTYISSRGDLLSTFFALSTFFVIVKTGNPVLATLLYLLSLLSKESSVVLPFILLSFFYFLDKNKLRLKSPQWITLIILIVCSVGYTLFRLYFQKHSDIIPLSFVQDATLYARIVTLPKTIVLIFQLMFLPINLCSEYLFVEKTVSIYYLLLCFIITLFLIHILNKHLLPTQRTKILFFFGWFFISFGPFYNIFLPLTATLRPHWLYFPGIGFLSGTIFIISYFFKKTNSKLIKFSIKTFILIWILALTVLTIQRNSQWHDPIILYSHDVKLEPKSFTLYNNLGVEYFRKGEINKAKECFLKSIETSPENRYDVAWNNIGVIYENENQPHLAINAYKKSIELGNYKLAFSNLGRLYLKLGKINDAVLILQQGKKFYPYDEEINYYLSLINQSFQTVNFN